MTDKFNSLDFFSNLVLSSQDIDSKELLVAGSEKGLDIYRQCYVHTLLDSLKNSYPAVLKLLGESNFNYFGNLYIQKTPSLSPNLNDYGAELGHFLVERAELKDISYVLFIAQLDWFWFHSEENQHESIQLSKGSLALWDCITHDKNVEDIVIDPNNIENVCIIYENDTMYLVTKE
ncbi:MAG: DUF2063 domain-containing protein [Halobacteriovoraceae bacterium]|jgi:hypothetical protein|nr:DUF2063 domain-containing protein [Halobacteriovoraceae bacterium]